jgi:hypothetical protein
VAAREHVDEVGGDHGRDEARTKYVMSCLSE